MPTPIALTMSTSTVTWGATNLPPLSNVEACVSANRFSRFPAPWAALSGDPMIQIQVTNNGVTTPIAPILCDVYTEPIHGVTRYPIVAEMVTVMPGQTVTELFSCLPVTTMALVFMTLSAEPPDVTNGWNVTLACWKL